ncbi:MAG: hypothetical protein U5K00_15005 [Melioribacteraceae bacterium]|nr:hypothetical protein [Melioribacteraceae bacterium]
MARILKNRFGEEAILAEYSGADKEKLKELLGRKREMLGIFDGDAEQGMMEAGQGSGLIKDIPSVKELMERMIKEYDIAYNKLMA